jgi:bifunctional non-homologous end joining protein LigD
MSPRTVRDDDESRPTASPASIIPDDGDEVVVRAGRRKVRLTNLSKVFFPEQGLTKRDLLRYYAAIGPVLIPHLRDRAMVMKRYPNGIEGEFFFMKRTPAGAPDWLKTCSIEHASGNVIDFPMVQDQATLLWLINLGCIDLNPWYSRCDDIDRPDFLNFDLDPVPPATFTEVRQVALLVKERLDAIGAPSYPKTSGSKGIHIYVPIRRGPLQKRVWTFAKAMSRELAEAAPDLVTAEYRIAKRPAGRVLVDYNQNAWGRTLASVYSVRPRSAAPVSAPVSWPEVEGGITIEDFSLRMMPARVAEIGDLWKKVLQDRGRFDLTPHI